ncbi:serine/threonine-protein kinase LMTK1-like [Microcaecilia unicolor]|uniref:non-specific serine/threonine protein kinase n=1 Tax=Microcaecilia unicolor TaxID=1415580 RepID=A0A6P7YI54_9AMPH|nr:serine/threonine-protein kinase LMTK1-like [Microcaecilia unicolor]
MLACLCCKKGDVGFKEFDNAEGEECTTEFSMQGSPAAQNGPEVYILPLTEVSLPMSKQPGRSVQLLKSTDLGRHSLLYLKEIGHGWFGKVLLGEVNSGVSSTQVVVKELKASASVQEQMQFLEEAQPYRALQHTNLLQCLAQCAEVTPYLLVMEYCPLGDLKGYLRSCRAADSMAPDPLTLQRMACEVACGLLHLHRNNYVHSDLALRNCSLTADLIVKIGDYGLSHCKYKEDYFVTTDQLWVPLRWIAPELIDEVHGNLLVVDQTKSSNIWSLGVTIWELFELGNQPYHHYTDRQVLTYAVKEQQLKLPKPQMKLSLSDRWYEVMQFCWLQSDQRPTAEEIHLLLSYLCAKGATEAEEEFEKRWNSMKPSGSAGASTSHQNPEVSSFPLLDDFHADGDDILTVTETSHGLNFEYKWEHTKPETLSGTVSPSNAQYQDMYYSSASTGRLSLEVSPSCYECKQGCQSLHAPGVVPILSAHSPSVSSEYYIRIEEPSECNAGLDYTMGSYSPEYQQESPTKAPCWCGKEEKGSLCDSDNSPTVSVTMEPLLAQDPLTNKPWQDSDSCTSYKSRNKVMKYNEQSPANGVDQCLLEKSSEMNQEWSVPSFRETFFKDPLGVSCSMSHLCRERDPVQLQEQEAISFPDRFLEQEMQKAVSGGQKGNKAKSEGTESVTVEVTDEERGQNTDCESRRFEEDITMTQRMHWASNSSANNNISTCSALVSEHPDAWCHRHVTNCKGLVTEPSGPEPWQKTDLSDVLLKKNGSVSEDHQPAQELFCEENSFTMKQRDCGTLTKSENSSEAAVMLGEMPPEVNKIIDSELEGFSEKTASSLSFNEMDTCSDDETAELTSGVFMDFSSDFPERADVAPPFKSLQKQVGTPDSLESLEIPSTSSSCEVFSPTTFNPSSQPKALDSGYNTENFESPEFVLKEPQEGRDPEVLNQVATSPSGLTINELSGPTVEIHMSSSLSSELHSLDEKNPYRDSAYFSDYDTDVDKYLKEEEEEEEDTSEFHDIVCKSPVKTSELVLGEPKSSKVNVGIFEQLVSKSNSNKCPISNDDSCNKKDVVPDIPAFFSGDTAAESFAFIHEEPTAKQRKTQDLSSPTKMTLEREISGSSKVTVSEDCLDDGLGLEENKEVPDGSYFPSSDATQIVSSKSFSFPSGQLNLEAKGVMSLKEITAESELDPDQRSNVNIRSTEISGVTSEMPCPLAMEVCGDQCELQEYVEQVDGALSETQAPQLSLDLLQRKSSPRQDRGNEADEEEEDTEDSDESDEELRCYNIQEQSEESEDEASVVPVVVSVNSNTRRLRSLLKMPSLLSQSFCEELERKKKVVSFFDDVTVYLFDQIDNMKKLKSETRKREPSWDVIDFPLVPVKSSFLSAVTSVVPEPTSQSLPSVNPVQKQILPVQFSRFTVSAAPVSRFSITHVSDSDAESVRGEDGERE